MRVDVSNAARRHALIRHQSLRRSHLPSRTFISRRQTPEEFQETQDAINGQFPLISASSWDRRPHANPEARNIAIVGGGISGLSTALFLTKELPQAKITILEKNNRLGGWLDSERINVDSGDILFEWGPRSLRSDQSGAGSFTESLLHEIIEDTTPLIAIGKDSPAARNRFIFYGDRLVKMPGPNPNGNLFTTVMNACYKLVTEPIFSGLIPSILAEPWVKRRSSAIRDESVGDFVRRRFGKTIADNLVSALFHGIYAGDINKLSARTLLPKLWYLESRDKTESSGVLAEMLNLSVRQHALVDYRLQRGKSIFLNYLLNRKVDFGLDDTMGKINNVLSNCSIYTFADGLQQLGDLILAKLSSNPNVTFLTGRNVQQLDYNIEKRSFTLVTATSDSQQPAKDGGHQHASFDHAIATIRPSTLMSLLTTSPTPLDISTRVRSAVEAVSGAATVMVVNLYYASPKLLPSSLDGFGYLIPASVSLESNPERALGVIFSSSASGPRGPNAIQHQQRPTAEELRYLRENLEHKFETDYERKKKIQRLAIYMKRAEEDENHIDNDENVHGTLSGETMAKFARLDLEIHEQHLQHYIDKVRKQEWEAQKREEQPDFDPENNYDEVRVGQDSATGTKLAVMLGGHWWDGWAQSDLPTENEAVEMAKKLLERHLNVTEEPLVAKAKLQRDCIPQYPVGYRDYMATIHKDMLAPIGSMFDGRLKVAGTWWQGGVGVNDCVRKGRETAASLREGWNECTGLEEYVGHEKWCLYDRRARQLMPDLMSINRS